MQDARNAILTEIREVTARTPGISPQMIVNKINEVENSPGHRGHDVQLAQGRDPRTGQPCLDIVPIQGYGQPGQPGYGQNYGQPQELPPQGAYPPGGYPPQGYEQPPVVYEQQPVVNPVLPLAIGIGLGAIIAGAHRGRRY
jgi:hypothetical protein